MKSPTQQDNWESVSIANWPGLCLSNLKTGGRNEADLWLIGGGVLACGLVVWIFWGNRATAPRPENPENSGERHGPLRRPPRI
jgi:hypothetical protein